MVETLFGIPFQYLNPFESEKKNYKKVSYDVVRVPNGILPLLKLVTAVQSRILKYINNGDLFIRRKSYKKIKREK